jgi:steroid 5-alpha reductase family enzyme
MDSADQSAQSGLSQAQAWVRVAIAYGIALGIGFVAAILWPVAWIPSFGHPTLWMLFVFDVVATLVVFAMAVPMGNSSLYDPYWSVLPPVLLAGMAFASGGFGVRSLVVGVLVSVWAARLTWNWARGWTGFHHEDWRYVDLRRQTGPAWQFVNLTGIMLFPTLLVFAGCLALWPVVVSDAPLGLFDVVAFAFTAAAIAIELVSDEQLRAFRLSKPAPGAVLTTGLWAWSRHPNYLGELSFWWGLWLCGVAASPADALWTLVGPLSMSALFLFISIPMIERRMVARRPAYAEVQKRIPMLVPWKGPVG